METNAAPRKKTYVTPTLTRLGDAAEKTMGKKYGTGELRSPGGPPHEW